MKFKVASINIGRLKQDYENNLKILDNLLRDSRPDILLFQEYIADECLSGHVFDACGLRCSYFKEFSESHVADGEKMGIAVFSRDKIVEKAVYKLFKPDICFYYNGKPEYLHDKYFVSLLAEINGKEVKIITGHGHSFHRYKVDPADFIEIYTDLDAWICGQVEDKHTLILGDFNLQSIDILPKLNEGFKDIFAGFATRPNGRKTDYILIPKENGYSDVLSIKCGSYNPDIGFDHNFLVANIEI